MQYKLESQSGLPPIDVEGQTSSLSKGRSVYLIQNIELTSGEEGFQAMEWCANLLVAGVKSEIKLAHIPTCSAA